MTYVMSTVSSQHSQFMASGICAPLSMTGDSRRRNSSDSASTSSSAILWLQPAPPELSPVQADGFVFIACPESTSSDHDAEEVDRSDATVVYDKALSSGAASAGEKDKQFPATTSDTSLAIAKLRRLQEHQSLSMSTEAQSTGSHSISSEQSSTKSSLTDTSSSDYGLEALPYCLDDVKLHPFPAIVMSTNLIPRKCESLDSGNGVGERDQSSAVSQEDKENKTYSLPPVHRPDIGLMSCSERSALFLEGSRSHHIVRTPLRSRS